MLASESDPAKSARPTSGTLPLGCCPTAPAENATYTGAATEKIYGQLQGKGPQPNARLSFTFAGLINLTRYGDIAWKEYSTVSLDFDATA